MRAFLLPLAACAALAGCAYSDPYYGYGYPGYGYPQATIDVYSGHPGYHAPHPAHPAHGRGYRDRDRDGIPNRVDRDRDNDGVPNRHDARPNNPRRY